MERRLRHTGIEAGIGVAAPTRAPGLRSIQEILAPVMARLEKQVRGEKPAPDPLDDGDRHAVAESLVTRAVGGGLAAIGDERPVVGKSLKALRLSWGQSADGGSGANRLDLVPRLQRVRYAFLPALTLRAVLQVLADGALLNGDGRRMGAGRERVTGIAGLRVAVVPGTGDLRRVEGDQSSVAVEVGSEAAARTAAARDGGSDFPRFSARRRIPAQAFALKKYRCGRAPVSKMSDNEDATASLGHSEVLSVKNSVGEPIPEFPHRSEKGSKIPSSVTRQEAGDVLENEPAGAKLSKKTKGDEGQVAARVIQPEPSSGDAERLAGAPEDDEVNRLNCIGADLRHVAVVHNVREARRMNCRRERVDLGTPAPIHPRHRPLGSAYAGEQGCALHGWLARLAAQQFADRSALDDVIGWHRSAFPAEEVKARDHEDRGDRTTGYEAEAEGEERYGQFHCPSPHPVAEREAGGEDQAREQPALAKGEHQFTRSTARSAPQ